MLPVTKTEVGTRIGRDFYAEQVFSNNLKMSLALGRMTLP